MKIYFVRHGESILNAKRVHQPLDISLSENGEQQARLVANRFRTIDFDVIISSDLRRAHQTAEAIQQATGKDLITTELARERFQPSVFHNKSIDDPMLKEIKKRIEENADDPTFRYADEENFSDLKRRAHDLLLYLESRPEQNLVVVLHGTILRYLLTVMAYGKDFDWKTFIPLARFVHLDNTGVTVCEKHGENWQMITWNDQAHLGE